MSVNLSLSTVSHLMRTNSHWHQCLAYSYLQTVPRAKSVSFCSSAQFTLHTYTVPSNGAVLSYKLLATHFIHTLHLLTFMWYECYYIRQPYWWATLASFACSARSSSTWLHFYTVAWPFYIVQLLLATKKSYLLGCCHGYAPPLNFSYIGCYML